jgi:hypothetical protein
MKKIDARKLPRDALDEMRRQAMRIREELQLPWHEVARVVGVHVSTVFIGSKRFINPAIKYPILCRILNG